MNLKISGHNYEVRFIEGMGVQVGATIQDDNVIRVSKNMADSQKEATLLHEIIHAVADNFGLDLTEQAISILGGGLHQVLKDNYKINLLKARE